MLNAVVCLIHVCVGNDMCNETKDCKEGNVLKECYFEVPWSEDSNFCNCSSWYGFVGDDCDIPSPQVWYIRFTLLFIVTWATILLIFLGKDIILYLRFKFPRIWNANSTYGRRRYLDLDPVFVTA